MSIPLTRLNFKSNIQKFLQFMIMGLFAVPLTSGCKDQLSERSESEGKAEQKLDNRSVSLLEVESEKRFRSLFAYHLKEFGYEPDSIHQTMFLTPKRYQDAPKVKGMSAFLSAVHSLYIDGVASEWYQAGLRHSPEEQIPKSGSGRITFIVLPGFSSEYLLADPFDEILGKSDSKFCREAKPKLDRVKDEVYNVKEQRFREVKLSEVVRVGSLDRGGQAWANVVMLTPKLGSLESIGPVDQVTKIYQRRLTKIFESVPNMGKVYLIGYSRGTIMGLELLRATEKAHKQDRAKFPWINRIYGIVGLGGVFYGSELADAAYSNKATPINEFRLTLEDLLKNLEEAPQGLTGLALSKEVASRVIRNTNRYAQAINKMARAPTADALGMMKLLFTEEQLRKSTHARAIPGIFSNFNQTKGLLFDLIHIQCPASCYFQNIKAFKEILHGTLEGIKMMSTEARMAWWKDAALPARFRILSLSATMPEPVKGREISPIITLPHYGYRSPDFIFVERPSYYVMLESGGSTLNDSAVSLAKARYWPQLDPVNGRRYDHLGVIASHHFGIAFHTAVGDCLGTPNSFPRVAMLAALSSYLRGSP